MPTQVTNYQCPACTGPMHFDSAEGKLKCDYCGSTFEVAEIEALYDKKNSKSAAAAQQAEESAAQQSSEVDGWQLNDAGTEWGEDAGKVKVYNCPSCGAELICEKTTAATSCPYCDNPTIIPSALTGGLKPDLVVPFKYDKEQAKAALRAHLRGKKLLPKLFTEENHLDEVKGIYVPFWLFDAYADADITYGGTQTRAWSDSEYDYVETSYFDLERSGSIAFDNVPVDGSEKMDNELMESIEPFDISQAVDFKTAYLAGYMADKYDVNAKECVGQANERIQQSVSDSFMSTTAGFGSVTPKASRIRISNGRAKYALLPVWILNTTWNGKKYVFAMNGQTGKFVGNLPMDRKLKFKWQLLYTGIFSLLLLGLNWLLFM